MQEAEEDHLTLVTLVQEVLAEEETVKEELEILVLQVQAVVEVEEERLLLLMVEQVVLVL
jgi:hypothetical protein